MKYNQESLWNWRNWGDHDYDGRTVEMVRWSVSTERAINMSQFELMIGIPIKTKENIRLMELIDEEVINEFNKKKKETN